MAMDGSSGDVDFSDLAFGYATVNCSKGHRKYMKRIILNRDPNVDVAKYWCSKSSQELREYCDVIKIYIFWPLLFEKLGSHAFNEWPLIQPRSIRSLDSELTLKELNNIELLEDIFEMAKKVVDIPFFITRLLKIGKDIETRQYNIGDALEWVKCTGDIGVLQKLQTFGDFCWPPLEVFFSEYKYFINKVAMEQCSLVEEFKLESCESCVKESEVMKQRGNEAFCKENYDCAVKFYTEALDCSPVNHLLYGNRALCFLRLGTYKKALGDGKRATVLKCNWSKGHYRFCDALFLMGECERALEANERAQDLCRHGPEGVKDLLQQNVKFRKLMEEMRGVKHNQNKYKKNLCEKKLVAGLHRCASLDSKGSDKRGKSKKELEPKDQKCSQKPENKKLSDSNPETKASPSEVIPDQMPKNGKTQPESKANETDKLREHTALKSDVKNMDINKAKPCSDSSQLTVAELTEKTKALIHDGYTSLLNECCHSAAQAFSQLLNILSPTILPKVNLANIDYVVIIYGHASSLLGIGQPEELAKAEQQFNKIITEYTRERFHCLAVFGIGKVYFRQNRFTDALKQFEHSQTMVNHKIVPGVLTWPTTSVVLEETRMEKLQVLLDKFIKQCKFPPEPDAVCRYPLCLGQLKIHIYFSDPDFKGFVRLICCQLCKVEFHIGCWKKLKATMYPDRSDRDFLEEQCFTPDCVGKIYHIIIFNNNGIVKCEFKHKVQKIKKQPRPVVKQKSCSPRNLSIIQEKKLKRKLARKEAIKLAKEKKENPRENSLSEEDIHKDPDRYRRCFDDMIMQHITENTELIKTGVLDPPKLLDELLSWQVISELDYTIYSADAASMSSAEVMDMLINHLSQEDNKVNTRLFLYVLNHLEDVRPKLKDWLEEVNTLGLKAAEAFLARYSDCLEKLNFDTLLSLWNEKYGNKLDSMICNHSPEDLLAYFHKAPPEKARWLIWLLQENKEKFACPALHQALDCYFKIMDGPCIVFKKQENEDGAANSIKVKNKSKKKKQKESKPLFLLSREAGAGIPEDILFPDDNTLMYLDDYNPFIVPEYIRCQVEEFETLYEDDAGSHHYQRILEDKPEENPDPTRESLYDYFSQILKEYGPLKIDDPILVDEYRHFPVEAHRLVEESGGLQTFLLKSCRFVMVGHLIGLTKHALLLKETTKTSEESAREHDPSYSQPCNLSKENNSGKRVQLNPAAEEFKPISNSINKPCLAVTSTLMPAVSPVIPVTACSLLNSYCPTHPQPGIIQKLYLNGLQHPSIPTNICVSVPNTWSTYYLSDNMLPMVPDSSGTVACSNADGEQGAMYDIKHESNCPQLNSSAAHPDIPKTLLESNNSSFEVDLASDKNSSTGINYNTSLRKRSVFTKMVAVQVDKEFEDNEVNTDPFHPFETRQGDILRIEKEHRVLQEQLKEATEKYDQLQNRSRADITAIEEQLQKTVDEQKISKAELDWFHQDLENEVKKWQQEKKENQERLKTIKNNVKTLTEANDTYLRNIEEKEQRYKKYLAEFLEISNKFAAKKMKVEEDIKKSKHNFKESVERAVVAEVSLLHHKKEYELLKLHNIASEGKSNLGLLQSKATSGPVSASAQLKSQISSLDLYLLKIQQEINKTKFEFEEQINRVDKGVSLSTLSPVKVATFQPPPNIPIMQDSILINDPAVVMYSSAPTETFSTRLCAFPSPKKQGIGQSTVHNQTFADKTGIPKSTHSDSGNSAGLVDKPSLTTGKAYAGQAPVSQSVSAPKAVGQNTKSKKKTANKQLAENIAAPSKPQMPKKSYEKITEQLLTIFPHLSSTDLDNFIKEVRSKNGNTLADLGYEEMISQVTEHILDQPSKTPAAIPQQEKLPVGKSETTPPHAPGAQAWNVVQATRKPTAADVAKQGAASLKTSSSTGVSRKSGPSQLTQPWRSVGGPAKSKWQKSTKSAPFEDPCIICHEELSPSTVCVLECGHQFHNDCIKTWLHAQSTCPTCRVHTLLPEDFPALSGRIRLT
uniref:RING-type E3 ubiquitin transferase n=1 Tax=Geotrypetes seraphini TaxID=260995 RepID=A0A6P8R337_GEOSA|nr:E3 ubiquitin-protein ligase TTC3 isoform X2 [Geotrypetes seraphini]